MHLDSSAEMEYCPARYWRVVAGLGALAFTFSGFSQVWCAIDREFHYPYVFIGISVWSFALAAWSAVVVVTWHRNRLVVTENGVIMLGVWKSSLKFVDVVSAHWYWQNGGVLKMRTKLGNLRVAFFLFPAQERKGLVLLLRRRIPELVQHGWPTFCQHFRLEDETEATADRT
jgi:hypothetical protein